MNRILKAVAAVMLLIAMVFAAGCHKDPENEGGNGNGNSGGGTEAGLYLGVIGFNDQLKTKPIGLLNSSSEQGFISFIDALSTRDGTALYHAVNTSLDWLQNVTMPEDLMNVSIVTFTDGLDNASMMLNDQYGSQTEFLNAINHRIKTEKVGGLDINAYAVGMKGTDVQDETSFQRNLQQLSSSPSNVFEVENMEYVTVKFREIATQLYNETTVFLGAGVKIPGGYDNNTVLRITFDNVNNANTSSTYIEGSYSRENGQGKLTNIKYCGLQSTSGATITSDRQDGTYYWFTFKELKTLDGIPVTNTTNMKLWRNVTNTADWQPESEFTPSSYSEIQVDSKSAVIVLVLDCTTSLGSSDFYMMKDASKTFVEVLGHYGNNNGGVNGNVPSVIAADASAVTSHSAVCGGTIINDGGSPIISRGVCWSLQENPTLDDNIVLDESLYGDQFSCQLIGLESATTYYYRPFAMNKAGVGYGEQRSFTTETANTVATINNIFVVYNANLLTDDMPAATSDQTIDVFMNGNVIPGGSSYVTIAAEKVVKKILIGLEGQTGHFEFVPETANRDCRYSFVLMVNQIIPLLEWQNIMNIQIAVVDECGDVSQIWETPVEIIEVGTGRLQVSLSFDNAKDVDLHLIEPEYNNEAGEPVSFYGRHIYYGNQYSTAGGWLDLDSNPSCSLDYVNNENITYNDSTAYIPAGTYKVYVDMYSNCDPTVATNYVVTVFYGGNLIAFKSGIFEVDAPSTYNPISESYVEANDPFLTFDIAGNGEKMVKSFKPAPLTQSAIEKKANSVKQLELLRIK